MREVHDHIERGPCGLRPWHTWCDVLRMPAAARPEAIGANEENAYEVSMRIAALALCLGA